MELFNKTFVEWFKSLNSIEKGKVKTGLSKKCDVEINTVYMWGLGYRIPRIRSQVKIAKWVSEYCGVEITKEILFPSK